MSHKTSRPESEHAAKPAARPAWRLPENAAPPAPRGARAKWLLALAIILQVAWIAALIAMAMFVRWEK